MTYNVTIDWAKAEGDLLIYIYYILYSCFSSFCLDTLFQIALLEPMDPGMQALQKALQVAGRKLGE